MKNYYALVTMLLVALPSILFSQLEWTVGGALQSKTASGHTYYSTDTDTIQKFRPGYSVGDPIIWGTVLEPSSMEEWDFAIKLASFNSYNGTAYNNPDASLDNAIVVLSDKTLDWHIGFYSSLDNEIEIQFHFYEVGTYDVFTDSGTSKNIQFGVISPHVSGVVQRLHSAEFYTIDNLDTNTPAIASVTDPFDQLNAGVFTTDTINTENQDVDEDWLEFGEGNVPQSYPYSESSNKVFLHTMETAPYNTCSGCNANGRLAPSESSYEILISEASAFSVKRKDLSKDGSLVAGMKSAIGITGGVSALPVELTLFTAKPKSFGVQLDWITESEENNKGFFVERSKNTLDWEALEFIKSTGAKLSASEYDFIDRQPYAGDNYYRLRQVDYDEQTSYSDVAYVNFENKENRLNVFPNPANAKLSFDFGGTNYNSYVIEVFDTNGILVKRINTSTTDLDIQFLPSGIYYLSIIPDNQLNLKTGITFLKK